MRTPARSPDANAPERVAIRGLYLSKFGYELASKVEFIELEGEAWDQQ
jgi:hypothetical protein